MNKKDFKRFNPETTPSRAPRSTEAMLSIAGNQLISLNRKAVEEVGITEGSKIEFLQHPELKDEWRIEVTPNGFPVRFMKGEAKVYNSMVAAEMKAAFECPSNWSIRFKLAKDGKMFSLLKVAVIQPRKSAE